MFTTFILVCHIMTKECITLQDNRGSLYTEEQCKARAVEMSTDITNELPFMVAVEYKCLRKGEPA